MHLDENLEVVAWQIGDLVHREGQLNLRGTWEFALFNGIILFTKPFFC